MSRSFAELLPTPLTAESLARLQPLTRAEDLLGRLPNAHGWSWHAGDQAALDAPTWHSTAAAR